MTNLPAKSERVRLPNEFIWTIVFICIFPTVLNSLGFNFGSNKVTLHPTIGLDLQRVADVLQLSLAGSFLVTILEWSAFWTAMFTVILAFTNYKITGDVTTPIIGTVLFCAGAMDGFHTLIIYQSLNGRQIDPNLIPLTWAISQLFYGLLMLITTSLFVAKDKRHIMWEREKGFGFAITISLLFCIIAYGVISLVVKSPHLPTAIFPYSAISRPWDTGPLVLFLITGIFILPKFYKRHESIFSHSLLVSIIPQIFSQIHMAFDSTAIFDNNFNIAHFLKVISYLIPFCGLVLDYHRTYRETESINSRLIIEIANHKATEEKLKHQTVELKRSNEELQQFAYVASHDLQEPLRMVASFTQLLKRRYKDKLDADANEFIDFAVDGVKRMQGLINDLLQFSRITTQAKSLERISSNSALETAINNLKVSIEESKAKITYDKLPVIVADDFQMVQLFQNLIGNGIKYRGDKSPEIKITSCEHDNKWQFSVADNGIGIEKQYFEKIFLIFQRLHTKNEYSGTGIGLAVCKKIIERHSGELWVESELEKGTIFHFTIPMNLGKAN
jgi:signal transduction histidine kinase